MRDDMAKLIVERPRYGGGVKYPRAAVRGRSRYGAPPDGLPRRQGIRKPWRLFAAGAEKHFNENLAPLHRFLRSQAGRPWDKVRAEIAAQVGRDSVIQFHVWQHIEMDVCTEVVEVGRRCVPLRGGNMRHPFYVHPRTGPLRENKERRRYRQPPPATPTDRVRVDDEREYRRIDGIWYELTLLPVSEAA